MKNANFKPFILLVIILITNINSWSQTDISNHLALQYMFDGNGKNSINSNNEIKINDSKEKNLFGWEKGKDGKENNALKFMNIMEGLKTGFDISPNTLPELTYTAWIYGQPKGYLLGTSLSENQEKKNTSRTLMFSKTGVSAGYTYFGSDHKPFFGTLSSQKLKKDEWNFIALSVNSKDSTMTLYVNDEYYEIKKETKIFHTPIKNQLILGQTKNNMSGQLFSGIVDEISIYNKCLNQNELSQISGINFKNVKDRLEREALINKILIIILVLFLLIAIFYMIYVLITEKKYKSISNEELNQFISDTKNNPDQVANTELASKYVEDAFGKWKLVSKPGEDEMRSPTNKKHFIDTYEALNKARNLKPTDHTIVNRMNELGELMNELSKRKFYGNIVLLIISLLVPIGIFLIQMSIMDIQRFMGVLVVTLPAITYILANYAPTYVVANRSNRFGGVFGSILSVLMGTGAAVAATQHYNQITWSDGSKTVESDLGSDAISLGFGLMVILAAILLSIVLVTIAAIIAFFRNYVFYK